MRSYRLRALVSHLRHNRFPAARHGKVAGRSQQQSRPNKTAPTFSKAFGEKDGRLTKSGFSVVVPSYFAARVLSGAAVAFGCVGSTSKRSQ